MAQGHPQTECPVDLVEHEALPKTLDCLPSRLSRVRVPSPALQHAVGDLLRDHSMLWSERRSFCWSQVSILHCCHPASIRHSTRHHGRHPLGRRYCTRLGTVLRMKDEPQSPGTFSVAHPVWSGGESSISASYCLRCPVLPNRLDSLSGPARSGMRHLQAAAPWRRPTSSRSSPADLLVSHETGALGAHSVLTNGCDGSSIGAGHAATHRVRSSGGEHLTPRLEY